MHLVINLKIVLIKKVYSNAKQIHAHRVLNKEILVDSKREDNDDYDKTDIDGFPE